jgi:hypothetical protein
LGRRQSIAAVGASATAAAATEYGAGAIAAACSCHLWDLHRCVRSGRYYHSTSGFPIPPAALPGPSHSSTNPTPWVVEDQYLCQHHAWPYGLLLCRPPAAAAACSLHKKQAASAICEQQVPNTAPRVPPIAYEVLEARLLPLRDQRPYLYHCSCFTAVRSLPLQKPGCTSHAGLVYLLQQLFIVQHIAGRQLWLWWG